MNKTPDKMIPESKDERISALERIIKDAIANGYHSCDESVAAVDTPRHGCKCWVAEAKLETDLDE